MEALTKLEAVNHMLLMSGESLVNDLDLESGLDTEVSLFILERFITDFQLRGLANNKYVKTFRLDAEGYVTLPIDTLSAELISYHSNSDGYRIKAVARQSSSGDIILHNVTDNDNQWSANKDYDVELVYSLEWEELDNPVKRAVLAASTRQYQLVMQGDADIDQYLGQVESIYAIKSKASDIDDRNSSAFSSLTPAGKKALIREHYNDPSRFRFWRHSS